MSLVTPNTGRGPKRNWCEERTRSGGKCSCHPAEYSQRCRCCGKTIFLEDCIAKFSAGWGHVLCPGERGAERGLASIEAAFNDNVEYGSSYTMRIAADGGGMPAPLRLEFGGLGDDGDDRKMPAAGETSDERRNSKMPATCEASDDGDVPQRKRAKITQDESESSDHLVGADDDGTDDDGEGEYADERRTNEQMAILAHEPKPGNVVAVNALAGCGKTTTIGLLCNQIREEDPGATILYLVYNKKMREEAAQSNKFPKDNMDIQTTHSYVLRHFFGTENMWKVKPAGDYKLEDIIDLLDLRSECKAKFPSLQSGRLSRRVNTIAGFVRKTLGIFQSSADKDVTEWHVFRRARESDSERSKWRLEIKAGEYVQWAQQFFDAVWDKCVEVRNRGYSGSEIALTFDGYLKVAQVAGLDIPDDYLCIDEAQDMTACQADLFWGQRQRSGKKTYLFGDKYQQLYRFRGASRAFREMVDRLSNPKLTLTGSFRFGKNIAAYATCVLKALGGETLHGRSNNDGTVAEAGSDCNQKIVVLCRTNNGVFMYLCDHQPSQWSFLDTSLKPPRAPKDLELDLEAFVKFAKKQEMQDAEKRGEGKCKEEDGSADGEAKDEDDEMDYFAYKGETFYSIAEIKEYIDDEGDIELSKSLTLLQGLVSRGKGIADFYQDLNATFRPMREGESPDTYNGVVLTTVHKAKGLEFECPVVISDDFRFEAIEEKCINKELHCDEANILYVAITRAKRHLRLSARAKQCLELLAGLEHVKMQLPSMANLESSREQFQAWETEWATFRGSGDAIDSVDHVIFPPDWDDDDFPFALHSAMSVQEQKKQLWTLLRCYHPDKFLSSRVGRRIQVQHVEDEVKKVLEQITRKCNDILGALREVDE